MTSVLSNSITAFTRAPATGALTQGVGPAGCIAALPAAGCGLGRTLRAARRASASRPTVAASTSRPSRELIDVLARDPGTGVVTQLSRQARQGRLHRPPSGTRGCATGRGLAGVSSVAVSPDGRFVYTGATGADAIAIFRRDLVAG